MTRAHWRGLAFWFLLAPGLLYALMALSLVPAILLRTVLGVRVESPLGQIVMSLVGLTMFSSALAVVWWIWRVYTYYPLHGTQLQVPKAAPLKPSSEYLEWHNEHTFLG